MAGRVGDTLGEVALTLTCKRITVVMDLGFRSRFATNEGITKLSIAASAQEYRANRTTGSLNRQSINAVLQGADEIWY